MSDLAMVLKLIKGPKQTINEYDYENDNNNDNDYQKWIKPQVVWWKEMWPKSDDVEAI